MAGALPLFRSLNHSPSPLGWARQTAQGFAPEMRPNDYVLEDWIEQKFPRRMPHGATWVTPCDATSLFGIGFLPSKAGKMSSNPTDPDATLLPDRKVSITKSGIDLYCPPLTIQSC